MNRYTFLSILKPALLAAFFAATLFVAAGKSFAGPSEFTLTSQYGLGPSITTARYTGSIVVTGDGFGKGELVDLLVQATDAGPNTGTIVWKSQAYADGFGRFETSFSTDGFGAVGERFVVRANGNESGSPAESGFSIVLAAGVKMNQCENGKVGDPPDPCSGTHWVTGNVNQAKAHWVEGQSLVYRAVLEGFTVGNSYSITIGYDTSKGGKRAIDYLTSFDRTETLAMGNNPCSGVAGCSLGTFTTAPIPVDSDVLAGFDQIPGNGDDVSQIPGVFTLFDGTISGVSGYTLSGTYAGDSSRAITVTFTANQADMVLAWGGHIATRSDWGTNNSAIFINGSPYHTYADACGNFNCGNQDLQLAAAAVAPAASIRIIKDAQPDSVTDFNFTASGQAASAFILDDDALAVDGVPDNVYSNTQVFNNLALFGPTNSVTITETPAGFYDLTTINCTSVGGTNNNIISVPGENVQIVLEPGEEVTCTFVNTVNTAAYTSVGGRVADGFGQGVSRARLTITDVNTGETQTAVTNSLGYYRFDELTVGEFYVVTVSHRKFTFVENNHSFVLNDAIENLDFTSLER